MTFQTAISIPFKAKGLLQGVVGQLDGGLKEEKDMERSPCPGSRIRGTGAASIFPP
jgi:hypothetical protein